MPPRFTCLLRTALLTPLLASVSSALVPLLIPLVPTVSTEAVLAANPEAIVTAAPGATAPDTTLPQLDKWRAWPAVTAVARNNLFTIDGDLINRPAPRLVQGATQLCEDLELARSRRPKQ